jgi:hypothetical protein
MPSANHAAKIYPSVTSGSFSAMAWPARRSTFDLMGGRGNVVSSGCGDKEESREESREEDAPRATPDVSRTTLNGNCTRCGDRMDPVIIKLGLTMHPGCADVP